MSHEKILNTEPTDLEGRAGVTHWFYDHYPFTGVRELDDRLSLFPATVFTPRRLASATPMVTCLQGMCVPRLWSGFLVPTLLDMGIGVTLIETPFAGQRSLIRDDKADVVAELTPLLERDAPIVTALVPHMMRAMARDIATVDRFLRTGLGYINERRALFGVSLGALFSSFAFMRDGFGQRLLGVIGHADLFRFARSYKPMFAPLASMLPNGLLARFTEILLGRKAGVTVDFLAVLDELSTGGAHCVNANPMTYAHRVTPERRVRFLVGEVDPVVRVADARLCARAVADGDVYPVPGMAHGVSVKGPSFIDHVRYYAATQLSDWAW